MNLSFVLLPTFGFLLGLFFHFNGVEICPTIEEFNVIIGESKINILILLTTSGDLLAIAQAILWVSLVTAQHWCMLDKLNIRSIFEYFSWLTVLVVGRSRSYYHNAFYLCILVRYFLVHETVRID